MDKTSLSERDICTKYITPALLAAGWDVHTQMREEFKITDGRVVVRGRSTSRAPLKRADYVLFYRPNIPIAVVEAKDNNHSLGDGMQQALGYAHPDCLNVPFAVSSNGDGFLFHDHTGTFPQMEFEVGLDEFPTPGDLWERYRQWKGLDAQAEPLVIQDFHDDGSGKTPRYYQLNAINRTRSDSRSRSTS